MKAPWIVTTRHSRPENGDIAKWDRNLSTTFGLGPRQFKRGAKLSRLIPQMTVFAMQTGSSQMRSPRAARQGATFARTGQRWWNDAPCRPGLALLLYWDSYWAGLRRGSDRFLSLLGWPSGWV